jgi:pyrimidine-nucleoside phosphorylase
MDMQSFIATRRDGRKHTQDDLTEFALGAAIGRVPDYQIAAWLMAAYLRPLTEDETAWLTLAMADSGSRVDLTGLPKPWVDKHSTGGVGDKTSIVLLPLLASCGLTVVKMSGRGLGITGGTVDKLGSIPGFRLDLSPVELKQQAMAIGLALTGQTPDLAPADKVLYALRDVTSTVGSVPLIVSSILSKKLAGGAETVVLDVKCGRGAFMGNLDEASVLADALTRTAGRCGLNIRIAITDMDQPLGSAIGNALEVREAIRVLQGEESRFYRHCVQLAGLTLEASGLVGTRGDGMVMAMEAIASGRALDKAREWFQAQGASGDVCADPDLLPSSPVVKTATNGDRTGWISDIDAAAIGLAVIDLGGGRRRKEDTINPSVGIELQVEVGSPVVPGQAMMIIHAADEASAELATHRGLQALQIAEAEVAYREPILRIL